MTQLDDALTERIRSARSLPSPPVVTARLIELCEDPDARIGDVVDLLGTDAALAARLMRMANSAIYSRRRPTENLRQAVTFLGIDVVLTASLSLMLSANRATTSQRSKEWHAARWSRSVHAAACAQILAEHVKHADPADAFLAALLQDIGIEVIDHLEPDAYAHGESASHAELIPLEQERLGVDHAAVGAVLLEEWRLPPRIVEAVRYSHRPDKPEATNLAAVVAIAGTIADGLHGEARALDRAATHARRDLGVDEATFAMSIEYLTIVLPDLASILDAAAPDPDTLAEMAEEAILLRQMRAQSSAELLQEEIENLRSVTEELKAQNGLDPLTGLSNRRRLDEILAQEFFVAVKERVPLSILFVDLDDFKMVNDRYGHGVGDELLTHAARRLSAAVRDGDLVARYGGEEFVVVLPKTEPDEADEVAQRVVDCFVGRPFRFQDDLRLVQTVSAGTATFDESTPYQSQAALVHAADLALYVAKRNGKNQFRRSGDTDPTPGESPSVADAVLADRS